MSSTDLVLNDDGDRKDIESQIEQAREQLPALIEVGDTETIKRWREEGKIASLATKRLGYETQARALARQAVRCSAALGVIAGKSGALGDGGSQQAFASCLALGAAMQRGRLEEVLDARGDTMSEVIAAETARRLGMVWVPRAPVAALIRKCAAERAVTIETLSVEVGLSPNGLYNIIGRDRMAQASCNWWSTYRLTEKIGIDISHLPPAQKGGKRGDSRRKRKWVTHRFRPGGGRWDEVGVRMVAMRDEMTRADPTWPNKPLLYEAMKTVSDIIQREIRAGEGEAS